MAERVWKQWLLTVEEFCDETALIDAASERHYTFRELQERVDAVKKDLVATGVAKGHVVVLSMQNGPAWLYSFLAIQAIGAVAFPLDPQLGEATIGELALLAGAKAIFRPALLPLLGNRRYRANACLIKATSGSISNSRSFLFRDEEMLADGRQIIEGMELSRDEINYALIPFGHSYGLGNLVFPLIMQGVPMVCGRHYFPAAIMEDWVRYQPTIFPAVPPLIRALSEYPAPQPLRLKRVISAGGKLVDLVRDNFLETHGVAVHDFYGSTESGGISYVKEPPKPKGPSSVGEPLPGVSIEIDSTGSIVVTSAAVHTYGNRHRRARLGRVRLADGGYWTQSGQLMLTGRRGREVKIAGRRISLESIENQLQKIAGVTDSYVTARPGHANEIAIEVVVAASIDKDSLKAAMKKQLPSWFRPKKIKILPEIPHNPRGKKDRQKLDQILNQ